MAAKETVISVPDGYTVKEDCCEMSMNQAVTLLCSEQQEKYTYAVRKGNGTVARLIPFRYVCPYCGEDFLDHLSFQAKNGEKSSSPPKKFMSGHIRLGKGPLRRKSS